MHRDEKEQEGKPGQASSGCLQMILMRATSTKNDRLCEPSQGLVSLISENKQFKTSFDY